MIPHLSLDLARLGSACSFSFRLCCALSLDKGVNAILGKSGHGQSASTTEKSELSKSQVPLSPSFVVADSLGNLPLSFSVVSDGIRTGFKKLTGKDVPVKDKT